MEMLIKFNKMFISGIGALFEPMIVRKKRVDLILNKTDEEALRSDWEKVGNDIRKAMSLYEQK